MTIEDLANALGVAELSPRLSLPVGDLGIDKHQTTFAGFSRGSTPANAPIPSLSRY